MLAQLMELRMAIVKILFLFMCIVHDLKERKSSRLKIQVKVPFKNSLTSATARQFQFLQAVLIQLYLWNLLSLRTNNDYQEFFICSRRKQKLSRQKRTDLIHSFEGHHHRRPMAPNFMKLIIVEKNSCISQFQSKCFNFVLDPMVCLSQRLD